MKYTEAAKLKKGDLVVINKTRSQTYGGLIFEIENVDHLGYNPWCCRVTLKQPGFDGGFRLKDYDTRLLQRYEP